MFMVNERHGMFGSTDAIAQILAILFGLDTLSFPHTLFLSPSPSHTIFYARGRALCGLYGCSIWHTWSEDFNTVTNHFHETERHLYSLYNSDAVSLYTISIASRTVTQFHSIAISIASTTVTQSQSISISIASRTVMQSHSIPFL